MIVKAIDSSATPNWNVHVVRVRELNRQTESPLECNSTRNHNTVLSDDDSPRKAHYREGDKAMEMFPTNRPLAHRGDGIKIRFLKTTIIKVP